MSLISAFFHAVGTWFGFVGSCIASPSGACVPFLAFLALGVAAAGGLTLLLLAYRSARNRSDGQTQAEAPKALREPARSRIGQRPVPA